MAKDQSRALRAQERYAALYPNGTDLVEKLPAVEEDDFPKMINPVTMEEMILLPRATSPKKAKEAPAKEEDVKEECSPNKAYMIRNGGFPGSSHLAGENALLLMASIY
jgi:hypothetical protein